MVADPGSGEGRVVRVLRDGDTAQTALLHVHELPGGFFARLGPRFLRVYHRSFSDSPHAVALVVERRGQVEGFLLGVLSPAPHGAYVLRRWGTRLALAAAVSLLTRPRLLGVFLRTRVMRYARGLWRRRRAGRSAASAAAHRPQTWAVLSHVAVDPACRGTGAGAALVSRLHEYVVATGGAGVVLLTEHDGPGPAFYMRLGYEDEGDVVGADGQSWRRFRWRVS